MEMNRISVPGKVMLSGEYAVLYGGKAIVAPVPRYVHIDDNQLIRGRLSPLIDEAMHFPISETEPHETEFGLPPVAVDVREFFIMDGARRLRKLGLGASAAETVAVVAYRFARAGLSMIGNKDKIISYAIAIHRAVQRGIGSGADVACCAHGRTIIFQRHDDGHEIQAFDENLNEIDLPIHLVWSGQEANTRTLVEIFNKWVDDRKSRARELIDELVVSSNAVVDAMVAGVSDEIMNACELFTEVMKKCAEAAGIPYILPIHEKLDAWARIHGGMAKPTGAGGGDMVMLLGKLPVHELKMDVIPIRLGPSK